MADKVQSRLEAMLPALMDFEQRKLFTKEEIRVIVKKRRAFEYALQRRQTKRIDYLRFIEYEMNLEVLRQRRQRRQANGAGNAKSQSADYSGVRQIHRLFRECLTKFPGDIALWLEWIGFCERSKSYVILNRAVCEALQKNPTNATLWICAANYEWETNGNVVASRNLFLRALRFNPESMDLWIEYFRLEMMFLVKILERRQVLGVQASHSQPDQSQYVDDGGNVVSGSVDIDGANLPLAPADSPVPVNENQDFFSGAVPIVVVRNAWRSVAKADAFLHNIIQEYRDFAERFPVARNACQSGLQHIKSELIK